MFKLAKWAYDLGVKHERIRIARQLEGVYHGRNAYIESARSILDEDMKMSKQRREKLQHRAMVAGEVREIVNEVLKPQHTESSSIMFPEEEK